MAGQLNASRLYFKERMSLEPEFRDWQQVLTLLERAFAQGNHELLLEAMLTSDEKEALITRANILTELLKGQMSQRQVSQLLGVGVATITRGSNALKAKSEQQKKDIAELLLSRPK